MSDIGIKKTVLVVDDDEAVLSFLTFSLKSEGFNVLEAADSKKAFAHLKVKKPDLILLDIMLPTMDGFSICQEIRKDKTLNSVPIIFITAYGDENTLQKTKDVGAQGLIEKPIRFDEVHLQILDALNGKFSLPTRLKFQTGF